MFWRIFDIGMCVHITKSELNCFFGMNMKTFFANK